MISRRNTRKTGNKLFVSFLFHGKKKGGVLLPDSFNAITRKSKKGLSKFFRKPLLYKFLYQEFLIHVVV